MAESTERLMAIGALIKKEVRGAKSERDIPVLSSPENRNTCRTPGLKDQGGREKIFKLYCAGVLNRSRKRKKIIAQRPLIY